MRIEALIGRLDKLDGPNPSIDEQIWETVGGWPEHEYRSVNYMRLFGTPVTASLDAATALVEKVLPGWSYQIQRRGDHTVCRVARVVGDGVEGFDAAHDHSAIALLLALLRALQSGGRS